MELARGPVALTQLFQPIAGVFPSPLLRRFSSDWSGEGPASAAGAARHRAASAVVDNIKNVLCMLRREFFQTRTLRHPQKQKRRGRQGSYSVRYRLRRLRLERENEKGKR